MISMQKLKFSDVSYSYDSAFDILRVSFKYSPSFYYEETTSNVFLRYDDNTDEIVGLQIIDSSKLPPSNLKGILCPDYYDKTFEILTNLFY